ncbi:MAG TPA: flavodoxin family protein [Candidatus Woesebacteria bacterium]|nr:flavodoxin family protein [Candidatus Woesebacteria bacterium]HNS94598.1 flavodoxin family protein [Candidatus Woesebacteria bacterium]
MKILIAFATLSGNTQMVSEHVADHLKGLSHDVTIMSQDELEPTQMNEYELVFLSSSTWGDGEPNPTSEVFMEKLKTHTEPFGAVKFAVFGLGDSSYAHYCGIVDRFEELLKEKGKAPIVESFKIDGYPEDEVLAQANAWAEKAVAAAV